MTVQSKVLPKFGFAPSPDGLMEMKSALREHGGDPAIDSGKAEIRRVLLIEDPQSPVNQRLHSAIAKEEVFVMKHTVAIQDMVTNELVYVKTISAAPTVSELSNAVAEHFDCAPNPTLFGVSRPDTRIWSTHVRVRGLTAT